MNSIKTAACQLLCDLQEDINLPDLVHYAETKLDWLVVYYNTEKGDALIRNFDPNLSNFDKKEDGFCYKTVYGKYIFLDNNQNPEQKLCALVHEIGHILLGHLDEGKIQNRTQNEVETNVFVKYVLFPKRLDMIRFQFSRKKIRVLSVVIAAVPISALSLAYFMPSGAPAIGHIPASTGNKTVYVTPSGSRYHAANCKFAGDGAIAIPLERAKESYAPCSYCNPNQ